MVDFEANGGCACGSVQYQLTAMPMFRARCHCHICQEFNQAEYADILIMRAASVTVVGREHIDFKFHRSPPLLSRGNCRSCGGAAVEEMNLPLMPNLTIVPVQTLRNNAGIPDPKFHMFYHRRLQNADDDLPKHSGYLSSQLGFSKAVLSGFLTSQAPL